MQTEVFCSHCDRKKAGHLLQSNGENLPREIPTSGDVHSHPLPLKWVTSNDGGTYKPAWFPSPQKGESDRDLETAKQRQN